MFEKLCDDIEADGGGETMVSDNICVGVELVVGCSSIVEEVDGL